VQYDAGYLGGYTKIPNLLIAAIGRLGITQEEAVLIVAVLSFQYDEEKLPRPGIRRLADMLGLSERSIRRSADALVAKGYLSKGRAYRNAIVWDFQPLFDALVRTDLSELTEFSSDVFGSTNGSSSDRNGRTKDLRPDRSVNMRKHAFKDFKKKACMLIVNPFESGYYFDAFDRVADVWAKYRPGQPARLTKEFAGRFQKLIDEEDLDELLRIMVARIDDAGSLSYFVPIWEDPKSYRSPA